MVLFAVVAVLGAGIFAGGQLLREPVMLAPVERGTAVDAVPGVVSVKARHAMDVRSEFEGRIVESRIERGARVEAGDVLMRLDTTEIEAELDRVRVELETEERLGEIGSPLRYDLMEAEEELAHQRELFEQGQSSRRSLAALERRVARLSDELEIERVQERRRLTVLRGDRARLERELEKMSVLAPMNGDVVEVFASRGDLVGARAPLLRLLSAEREIEATVSEENFAGVNVGHSATVRFLGYGARTFDASVSRIIPAADPETQRYTVHLDVEMPAEMMVPGITGEVSIILDERPDTLVIPRRALLGRQVFVVRDGYAELRDVEPGFVSLNRVEILSGVEKGEEVAVENLDRLRDGDRVRVLNPNSFDGP